MSQKSKISKRTTEGATDNEVNLLVDVRKMGYLRKLKKMKKRFFVLRKASDAGPARLEYYVSEKKWRSGSGPRRSIVLKTCFNIGRKLHSKNKYVLALYTQDDCFAVVMDSEEELEHWLSALRELQHDATEEDSDSKSKPVFEHVWQVVVDDKELEFSQDLNGPHHLCLTSRVLSLVKINSGSEKLDILEFPLMSIRRCGHSGKYFFIELGRSAVTGAGGIWMETEATIIAQNMHETILGAMKSSRNREEQGPLSRPRSASTSENSKPIATRRPLGLSIPQSLSAVNPSVSSSRERCDSLPSRSQTFGEALPDSPYSPMSGTYASTGRAYHKENLRPHTMYACPSSSSPTCLSYSPGSLSVSVCSNGSNISFEELETPQGSYTCRSPHSHPLDITLPSEHTITEVPGEYLMMSPSYEKKSQQCEKDEYLSMVPGASTDGGCPEGGRISRSPDLVSSPKITVDYMEMSSPTNVNKEGYIPMSVIGSLNAKTTLERRQKVSVSGEKSPTLQRNGVSGDGYIPMAPGGASDNDPVVIQDGYLDMTPLSSSFPKRTVEDSINMEHKDHDEISNNIRGSGLYTSFEDSDVFVLDKVPSLVQQTEDTSTDYIKPLRTCSVGSRPKVQGTRTRAGSVGNDSAKPSFRHLSVSSYSGNLKNGNGFGRSLSAPALPMSTVKNRHNVAKGDCDNDLMVIDYTKQNENEVSPKNAELLSSSNFQKSAYHVNGAVHSSCTMMSSPKRDGNFSTQHPVCTNRNTQNVVYRKEIKSVEENNFTLCCHCSANKCVHVCCKKTNINDLNSPNHKLDGHCSQEASVPKSQMKENFIPNILGDTDITVNDESSKNFQNIGLCCSVTQEKLTPVHQNSSSSQGVHLHKFPSSSCTAPSEGAAGCASNVRVLQERPLTTKRNAPIESGAADKSSLRISKHESLVQLQKPRIPVPKISCGHVEVSHENASCGNSLLLNVKTSPSNENRCVKVLDSPESGFDDDAHGDYVCLDFGQTSKYPLPTRKIDTAIYTNQNLPVPENTTGREIPSEEHQYMNVFIGTGHGSYLDKTSVKQDSLEVLSGRAAMNQSPVSPSHQDIREHAGQSTAVWSSSNSNSPCLPPDRNVGYVTKRVRSPQTLPAFRKQMSAPAVPHSLKADLPSPGRKSSCPVTASASMLKSSAPSPAAPSGKFISLPPFSGGPGLLKIASRSPDHSSVSSVSSMSDEISSDHSSPKMCNAIVSNIARRSITETQYENVSLLPRSSSSSRPSSVSSEKELNYASLDLAPASSDEAPRSPHTIKLSQPDSDNNEPPLLYAEIDFTKSEGLRNISGALREGRL